MTRALWELSLDELKALYAEGKLTREDFVIQDDYIWILNHLIAEYNPKAFQIFQWEYEEGIITREDLLTKNFIGDTVNHNIALFSKDPVPYFEWGSEEDREAVLALFEKDKNYIDLENNFR